MTNTSNTGKRTSREKFNHYGTIVVSIMAVLAVLIRIFGGDDTATKSKEVVDTKTYGWEAIKKDFYRVSSDKTYKIQGMLIHSVHDIGGGAGGWMTIGYKGRTWEFNFKGDTDYESLDTVNLKFKGKTILGIGSPWITTNLFYKGFGIPYFYAKWVGNPIFLVFLIWAFKTAFMSRNGQERYVEEEYCEDQEDYN